MIWAQFQSRQEQFYKGILLVGPTTRHEAKPLIFQALNDLPSLGETTQPAFALLQVTGQRAREGTSGGACDSRAFSR